MALYAFDGTWNKDQPGSKEDTNALKFIRAYKSPGDIHYEEGVGLRFGLLGRIIGGLTGAGGMNRVRGAWEALKRNVRKGDSVIDVVGFSRGPALALEFAEWTCRKPIKDLPEPKVRFLGLWDTVHSFGLPGNSINIGWMMSLPDNVLKCFHAMGLDERRHTFPLTRLSVQVPDATQEGRLYEIWFRGVHSDVGGGNRNVGLSDISLCWMYGCARRTGLMLEPSVVERFRNGRNAAAPISVHAFDPIKNRFRDVRWTDWVHDSVAPRPDTGKLEYNNPPAGMHTMDDDGVVR